jgi:hypothetical protein
MEWQGAQQRQQSLHQQEHQQPLHQPAQAELQHQHQQPQAHHAAASQLQPGMYDAQPWDQSQQRQAWRAGHGQAPTAYTVACNPPPHPAAWQNWEQPTAQAADIDAMFPGVGSSSFASMLLGGQEAQEDEEEGMPGAGSYMLSDVIGPFDPVQPPYEQPADSLWSTLERPAAPGGAVQHHGQEAAAGWGQQAPAGLGHEFAGGMDQFAGWGQHPGQGPVQWSGQA